MCGIGALSELIIPYGMAGMMKRSFVLVKTVVPTKPLGIPEY